MYKFVAHYLRAQYASNACQNKPAPAGSHASTERWPAYSHRWAHARPSRWRRFPRRTRDLARSINELKVLDTLTIFYRQRRMEFTVMWTKLLDGKSEYQVGLQAFSQEKEPWGLSLFNSGAQPLTRASAISAA